MSRKQEYHDGDFERVFHALSYLRSALHHLKLAGCPKTAARVRFAISSAKGALRNIGYRQQHAERRSA